MGRNSRWAGARSGPDGVEFIVVTEDGPSLALLQSGGLDVVVKVPSLEIDRLRGEGRILQFPFRATYYIAFNQRRPFWKSKGARQAMRAALDREAILQMQRGDGERACTWMPRDLGGPEHCKPQNIVSTLEPFAQATDDDLTLSFDSGSRNQLIAEKIQNDFKKKWKRDLALQARDWKSHLQALYRGDVGVYRMGWPSLYLDAYAHLSIFRSDSPNNHTGWASAAYDQLLDRMGTQPEGAKRQQLIAKAAALIDEEGVAAPLFPPPPPPTCPIPTVAALRWSSWTIATSWRR
jgi:oligopeptide transport system substrate-binding protein